VLLECGFLYLKLGCWDKSKEYLHQGLSLTRQIEFSGAEAFALTLLGQWELYRGNYLTAIDFFQQALPIHQAANADSDTSTINFAQKFQSTSSIYGCGLPNITADETTIDASSQCIRPTTVLVLKSSAWAVPC